MEDNKKKSKIIRFVFKGLFTFPVLLKFLRLLTSHKIFPSLLQAFWWWWWPDYVIRIRITCITVAIFLSQKLSSCRVNYWATRTNESTNNNDCYRPLELCRQTKFSKESESFSHAKEIFPEKISKAFLSPTRALQRKGSEKVFRRERETLRLLLWFSALKKSFKIQVRSSWSVESCWISRGIINKVWSIVIRKTLY